MVSLRAAVLLCVAGSGARAASKKKKGGPKKAEAESTERRETCDACMKLAQHAAVSVAVTVREGFDVDKEKWLGILSGGGYGSALCEKMLVAPFGGQIADELSDMVDDAAGDVKYSALADPRTLPELLCAPRSITEACPKKLYKPPSAEPPRERFSTAIWNARSKRSTGNGEIEVHLINNDDACGPTEQVSLAARFKDPSVRRLKPDEEKLISLAIVRNAQIAPPKLRVKALGAPCGDGVDIDLDFANQWQVFEVTTNKAFKKAEPRSPANLPLHVRLMEDRDARDVLPDDHEAKHEL